MQLGGTADAHVAPALHASGRRGSCHSVTLRCKWGGGSDAAVDRCMTDVKFTLKVGAG